MALKKKVREKGKIKLSRYFQEFEKGDNVAIVFEKSLKISIPKRLQGRSGKIIDKRGRSYIVMVKDQKKEKNFILPPVHLKKLKQIIN